MALRLKYAGWPEEAIEVADGIGPSLDAAVEGAPGPCSPCPPTPRCSSCERCSQTAASPPSTGNELLPRSPAHLTEAAIWQDVEFGSYAADLALWEELAAAADGPVVELGAGSGRVSLAAGRKGVPMVALERDPELVEELRLRADGAAGDGAHRRRSRPDDLTRRPSPSRLALCR